MNNSNASIRWFNTHTEGFGYLNGLKEVAPKPGQNFKPFWSSSLCLLEGDPQNPTKKYMNVTIVNPKLIDMLRLYAKALNSRDISVFVNARLADIKADPFIYPESSEKAGLLGVNWDAKIINLLYLKIGDQVVELKGSTTTDFGVPAQQGSYVPVEDQAPTPESNKVLANKPPIVKLSKNEPNFEETKARLKDEGYRWNADLTAWMLGEVKLLKGDPCFQEKYNQLKELGYSFNSDTTTWVMPKNQAPKGKNQGKYQSRENYQDGGYHRNQRNA